MDHHYSLNGSESLLILWSFHRTCLRYPISTASQVTGPYNENRP